MKYIGGFFYLKIFSFFGVKIFYIFEYACFRNESGARRGCRTALKSLFSIRVAE